MQEIKKNSPANAADVREVCSVPGWGECLGGHGIHPSILAWRIPRTEELDRLWFIGSPRVRHASRGIAHAQWQSMCRKLLTGLAPFLGSEVSSKDTGIQSLYNSTLTRQVFIWLSKNISLVAQRLKHLPPTQETLVRSLGWEDPLEKEMATHSSILAWRIPWTEEPGRLQSTGSQSWTWLSDFTFFLSLSKNIIAYELLKTLPWLPRSQ